MSGKITYIEDTSSSYVPRTKRNAVEAELTIAFAVFPLSSGEKLTKRSVEQAGRILISINPMMGLYEDIAIKVARIIESNEVFTINIAGNSLHTLRHTDWAQEKCDEYVLSFLALIKRHIDSSRPLMIRSGGQTGFDEAGNKAAIKMGIDTVIHFPKGWRFRPIDGKDVYSQELFRKRFENGTG